LIGLSADNLCVAGQLRWNEKTTLQDVQFDWEESPTQRLVRLTNSHPEKGGPVRVGMGGAEVEAVIAGSSVGVLHVRLAKAKMQKADTPRPARGKKTAT
jgi:hypothetical protein